jgi:hypothetical protein
MGTRGYDARLRSGRCSSCAFFGFVRRAPIISLMMLMAVAPLCTSGQAREVTVTITGYMSSGRDVTGVFAAPGSPFGETMKFNLVYSIDDGLGQPCGAIYSCIEQSAQSNPMTNITLMITGPGLPGNTFTFVKNQFSPTDLKGEAYRRILAGNTADLFFDEYESYTGGYVPGAYNGGSWVKAGLLVAKSVDPCWEYQLNYELFAGETLTGSSFSINVSEYTSTKGDVQKYVALGNFDIRNITILPGSPPPPAQCFIGNSR